MKKEYIYIGAAALLLYLWNKKKQSETASAKNDIAPASTKYTYTVAQIQSWDIQTLNDVKAEITANPSIYADPSGYLQTINLQLFNRNAASSVSTPAPSTSKPLPASNTGVVNPNTSTNTTPIVTTSTAPPTSTYSGGLGPLTKV